MSSVLCVNLTFEETIIDIYSYNVTSGSIMKGTLFEEKNYVLY